MSFAFNQAILSQLTEIINECNKQYFITKNQYYNRIEEKDKLPPTQTDLFDLIDTQHTLIQELEQTIKTLSSELSFKKLIIERKDHVLKDLNTVVLNKFIDKIYKQELIITELQKENCLMQKYKNNTISESNKQPHENYNWNIQPIITNITNVKSVPVNVIVPKNKTEYKGTLSFINSSVKPVKNIEKFINIKSKNAGRSQEKVFWSNGGKSIKKGGITPDKRKNIQSMILKKTNARSKTQTEYVLTNTNQETLSFLNHRSNRSNNNSTDIFHTSIKRSNQLNKNHSTLLNKSYDIIKKYQLRQNQSLTSNEIVIKNILN